VADAEGHLISSTDVARLSQPLDHAHIDPGCSRIPTGCHGGFKRRPGELRGRRHLASDSAGSVAPPTDG
jgi:hypothetical protein